MTPRRFFLILSVLLFPALLAAQTPSEQQVARVEFCANSRDCARWRPYVRLGDMDGPIWFLVSMTGMACEVDGMVANKLADDPRGRSWFCVWRWPRP